MALESGCLSFLSFKVGMILVPTSQGWQSMRGHGWGVLSIGKVLLFAYCYPSLLKPLQSRHWQAEHSHFIAEDTEK